MKTSFAALYAAIATSRFITGVRSESWQTELMEAGKGEDVKWLFVHTVKVVEAGLDRRLL